MSETALLGQQARARARAHLARIRRQGGLRGEEREHGTSEPRPNEACAKAARYFLSGCDDPVEQLRAHLEVIAQGPMTR